ncbi:putative WEB family protein [Helianthus annuus]|nr:putative WEB family protein [Helianthus annuus]
MIHQKKDKSPMQRSELESIEIELSEAKKAVRELSLKIEEAKLRSRGSQRKPKWRQQEDTETSVKTEDVRYTEVMNELEHMKQEMQKLKVDMMRVMKEKRHAERAAKASNSKRSTLLASMELMKKELQELDEEQTIVEFARIEAVKECESIELDREEEAKKKEMQMTLYDVNLVKQEGSPMNSITDELAGAKRELALVKGEGVRFKTSMDVIRDELIHVRAETVRLQEAEQKREVTVQSLNSKILRAKAKLEALVSAESKTNAVASNLVVTLEQLKAEAETTKKDRDVINEEVETMKGETEKTEYEIDVAEDRLDAAMEELKAVKSSESKALGNLRNLINTAVEGRDTASKDRSMITITDFEYEYLTGKAGGAAELSDKKIAAAQAWVEALKASEKELLMKIERAEREISELSIEVDPEADVEGADTGLPVKVVASPRRSVTKVRNKVSVKRVSLQKVRTPGGRNSGKLDSVKREKMVPNLTRLFSKKNVAMDEGVV